jgi:hypothetical protein
MMGILISLINYTMRFPFFWKRDRERDDRNLSDYTGIGGSDSVGAEASIATDRGGLLA